MEDQKADIRKSFMKRKPQPITPLALYEDPLKKREEFAVSLRKKKTHDLINAKRRKLMGGSAEEETKSSGQPNTAYKGYHIFEKDTQIFETMLAELCPMAAQANKELTKPEGSEEATSVNIVLFHSLIC